MICYGIGCIHDSAISQYQYACALSIYEQFQISTPMEIFDPVMDLVCLCSLSNKIDGCTYCF